MSSPSVTSQLASLVQYVHSWDETGVDKKDLEAKINDLGQNIIKNITPEVDRRKAENDNGGIFSSTRYEPGRRSCKLLKIP